MRKNELMYVLVTNNLVSGIYIERTLAVHTFLLIGLWTIYAKVMSYFFPFMKCEFLTHVSSKLIFFLFFSIFFSTS